jgi:hypothetical protein
MARVVLATGEIVREPGPDMHQVGAVDVVCPGCGETLNVAIVGRESPLSLVGTARVVLHPVRPEHNCGRGPSDGLPLPVAA